MRTTNIEAPWYEFQKKVNALFGQDPDIKVGEVYGPNDGSSDYAFDLEVRNHKKFIALDKVFPKFRRFGGVTLAINLFDEENGGAGEEAIELFATIFDGNPIVKDIKKSEDMTGTRHGFIRFKPEVIQFFHDDISDYNGNWSGLAQDIAREVFTDCPAGIHFCTAPADEP